MSAKIIKIADAILPTRASLSSVVFCTIGRPWWCIHSRSLPPDGQQVRWLPEGGGASCRRPRDIRQAGVVPRLPALLRGKRREVLLCDEQSSVRMDQASGWRFVRPSGPGRLESADPKNAALLSRQAALKLGFDATQLWIEAQYLAALRRRS